MMKKVFGVLALLSVLVFLVFFVFGSEKIKVWFQKAEKSVVGQKRSAAPRATDAPGQKKSTAMDQLLATMVKCPAGSFMMGSPASESGRYCSENQHEVTLTKPFWIGKYEVTQKEYQEVMGADPSVFHGNDHPVESVSWHDAMAYCDKLNELTKGMRPVGYKFSLPTEAQWEYACRAGSTECFSADGWYGEKAKNSTSHAVGSKKPNAWGIYDMHGNVWEWCRDWYTNETGAATDPSGPQNGRCRVNRGGCWNSDAGSCRSASRSYYNPDECNCDLGFRVALVPEE